MIKPFSVNDLYVRHRIRRFGGTLGIGPETGTVASLAPAVAVG